VLCCRVPEPEEGEAPTSFTAGQWQFDAIVSMSASHNAAPPPISMVDHQAAAVGAFFWFDTFNPDAAPAPANDPSLVTFNRRDLCPAVWRRARAVCSELSELTVIQVP
jgi:hypothetical protein